MSKRMLAAALAICVLAGGGLFARPAAAAGSSDSQTLQSRAKAKRDQVQSEKKARKDQRKADRQQRKDQRTTDRDLRHENRKSFLRRLWPFGKDEEQDSFAQQKRFGTGNPRDASQAHGATRPVTTKVRSHNRAKREGVNYTRQQKPKKGHASANSRTDKRYNRASHSHKNGEYRKTTRKQRHAPTGLNWNLQRHGAPAKSKLNKDGKYRPSQ